MIGSGPIHTMGFRAKRAIRAGEQMFSTYGSEDGGAEWFKVRRMEMMAPKESIIPPQKLPQFMKDFCSNIHAQFGIPLWETLLIDGEGINSFGVNASRLAPFDSGLGNARAKQFISRGERVEIGPGLILSSKLTFGTALGSLVFPWNHLTEEQQASLRILREDGQLKLQHQGYDTSWKRVDTFESYEDLSILPVGGQIGLLRRVGEIESSNCRLNILWELGQPDSVTVILELVATDDIESGEILKLNLPQVGTMEELELLHAELVEFGHPFYAGIFDVRPEEDEL